MKRVFSYLAVVVFIFSLFLLAMMLLGHREEIKESSSPHARKPVAGLLPNPPGAADTKAGDRVTAPLPDHSLQEKKPADPLKNKELAKVLDEAMRRVSQIDAKAAELPMNAGSSHFLYNPAQELTARFGAGGIRLASAAADSWEGTFRYRGAGAGSVPTAEGTTLTYHHPDGVVEWFQNREDGIEHGFRVEGTASDTGSRALRISASGLVAKQSGEDLMLADANGGDVLAYSGLKVWDATNKPLAAYMQPEAGGFQIVIADRGAVYPVYVDPVYTRVTQVVTLENDAGNRVSPSSVALDGDRMAVGMKSNPGTSGNFAGSVYVLKKVDGVWELESILADEDPNTGDQFGSSLKLKGDRLIVGTPYDAKMSSNPADLTVYRYGSVTCFRREAGGWVQEAKLRPSGSTNNDYFGQSLDMDGDTILIGSPSYDTPGTYSGAGYIYGKVAGTWVLQQKLIMREPDTTKIGLGTGVALQNGRALLIGNQILGPSTTKGCIYEYLLNGSNWTFSSRILLNSENIYSRIGPSISVDGDCLVVGTPSNRSCHVFRLLDQTWTWEAKLTSPTYGASLGFGNSVSVKNGLIAITASSAETWSGYTSGCVHLFRKESGAWTRFQLLTAPDGVQNSYFGTSVATDGNQVLVGGSAENIRNADTGDLTYQAGGAYLFEVSEGRTDLEVMLVHRIQSGGLKGVQNDSEKYMDPSNLITLPQQGYSIELPVATLQSAGPVPLTNFPININVGFETFYTLDNVLLIQNRGTIPLTGLSFSLSGPDASEFALSTNLPTELAAGSKVNVLLSVLPISPGENKSAYLTISSNDGNGSYVIHLTGSVNAAPASTGIELLAVAGRTVNYFLEDLATDADGHPMTFTDYSGTPRGSTLTTSGTTLTFTPAAGLSGVLNDGMIPTDLGYYSLIGYDFYLNFKDDHGAGGLSAPRIKMQENSPISRAKPLVKLADQTWGVLLTGEAATQYTVERSLDMREWKTLGKASTDAAGELFFVDYLQTPASGFYRMSK